MTTSQHTQLTRLPPIFIFLFEIQLLLCKECNKAIAITIALEHLKQHFELSEIEKNLWESAIKVLPLAGFQYSYSLIRELEPVSIISELPPPRAGLKCGFANCFRLFFSKQKISRHLSSSHGISTANQQEKYLKPCYIQSLTTTGYFFEISWFGRLPPPGAAADPPADPPLDPRSDLTPSSWGPDLNPLIAQFLAKHQKTRENLEKSKVFQQFSTADEFSSFLTESKYPRFLHNRDLGQLTPLFELPREIEGVFKAVLEYLLGIANCKIAYTPRPALYALNTFSDDSPSMKRFKSLQRAASLQRYLGVFTAFFAFLFNTSPYIPDPKPPRPFRNLYQLDPELQIKLRDLKSTLEQHQAAEISEPPSGSPSDLDSKLGESDLEDDSDPDSSESEPEELNPRSRVDPLGTLEEEIEDFESTFFNFNRFPRTLVRTAARGVLDFYIALIRVKIADPFTHPISSFFAIYSMDPKISSFRHISKISQFYSAFIYCSQLLLLEWGFQLHYSRELDPKITEDLTSFMRDYFHSQSATSLAEILALRTYIFKILPEISKNESNIDYINDSTLRYQDIVVSIENFRGFFRQSILYAAELLQQDLCLEPRLFHEIAPRIDLSQAAETENLFESSLGFNFLSKNPHFAPLGTWLQQKTLDPDSPLFSRWYSVQGSRIELKKAAAKTYLDRVRSFLKVLLLVVHISGGGPARGTETSVLLHTNTMKNRRTLVLHRDLELFIIRLRYSKTAAVTGRERQAVRALPKSVSFLILFYLGVILPFIQFLELESYGELTRSRELLFYSNKKALTSLDLARTFRQLSQRFLGQSISISGYRQLIQGFIRYFIDSKPLQANLGEAGGAGANRGDNAAGEADYSIENLAAQQMHHSKQTASLVYGRHQLIFPQIPADLQQAMLQFSLKFHDFFRISPLYFYFDPAGTPWKSSAAATSAPSLTPSADPLPALKFTRKHQQSFSSEKSVKKVKFSELSYYLAFEPRSLRGPTLDLGSRTPPPLGGDLDRAQRIRYSSPSALDLDSPRGSLFPSDDILVRLLQDFFQNPRVNFRTPEQREAFYYILKRTPCLTVVLPTAGGKTTLFLLAASLISSKTTIILVPLVALKDSLVERAAEFTVSCSNFEDQYEKTPDSSLVLASVESAQNPRFFEYCQSLWTRNQLDCMIFDEAHLIPLASSYRKAMHRLKQLRILPVPFYFFSATLSRETLIQLEDLMILKHNQVIRANINQPRIEYSVRFFQNERGGFQTHFAELFQFLTEFQAGQGTSQATLADQGTGQGTPRGSILIYFPMKTWVDQFQRAYADITTRFHADLAPEEKTQNLKDFEAGRFPILAATSALGAGYDFTNVQLVIHFYFAWGFTDFIQETGRACRQPGSRGYSIIYTTPWELPLKPGDSLERQQMKLYMAEKICRRRLIQLVFNEEVIPGCSPNEIPCDLCQERQQTVDQGPRDLQVGGFLDSLIP